MAKSKEERTEQFKKNVNKIEKAIKEYIDTPTRKQIIIDPNKKSKKK
jgi:hypothetical protein